MANRKLKVYGEYTNDCSHKQTVTYNTSWEAVAAAIDLKEAMLHDNINPPYHVRGLGYVEAGPRQFVGIVYYK